MFTLKRRKRPLQKTLNAVNHDDAKSTPSKRHRDRLNGELDNLTALLPFSEDVRGRLDKLSILRLSVGYLKVKKFLQETTRNSDETALSCGNNGGPATSIDGVSFSEGDFLLQALNGFVLVVNAEGCILYASPTIQDCLGFHQSDLVQQSIYELIHVDDRAVFQCQLHFARNPKNTGDVQNYSPQHLPPENSAFLERSFCCRFRCLLDNSSGFLALNFQGRLKYLSREDHTLENSSSAHSQLVLFAIASPVQPPSILQIRTKTLIFQTKHKLDFAPLSIDTRGKMVLGYTELELCTRRSGYQFIHAADMMHCADNHLRMIKTGESGFTVFRLLTKNQVWVWVQANARVVFKGEKPDFIIARQKPLTNEEGEEHLRQRRLQLPFNIAGEAVLYESLEFPEMQYSSPKSTSKSRSAQQNSDSLLGSLLRQDHSVYVHPPEAEIQCPLEQAFMDSHAFLSVPTDGWRLDSLEPSFNQDSMLKSLEKILGKEGAEGALKDLEEDHVELKKWEDALLRIHLERGDGPSQLNDILANDVFSYVEEALLKETNMKGYKQTKHQETKMWRGTTSQIDPVKLHQTCVLPRNQSCTNSCRLTNSKPGDDRSEDQTLLNRRSINDSHFLGSLHSRSLSESVDCGSPPAAVSFQLPFQSSLSQPESTNALHIPSVPRSQFTDLGLSNVFQSSKESPLSQSQYPMDASISQFTYDQKSYAYPNLKASHHIQKGQSHTVLNVQDTVSHGQGEYSSHTVKTEGLHSSCSFKI